jgi:hypothetical protein
MRRIPKQTAIILGCLILGMQFIPIAKRSENGKAPGRHMQETIDPQVGAILDRSCEDCHSNHTRWPWYSHVAPISWLLNRDVTKGRNKLDFSEWSREPVSANARMEICDAVSGGSMPLRGYTLLHGDAKLSEQDVNLICDWASVTEAQASAASSNAILTKTTGDR